MKMNDKKYFEHLKKRSKISFLLRKTIFLEPLAKEFHGKVLDIGCGLGEFLEVYPNAVGIDSNRWCVKYCKRKGLVCQLGNIYKLNFPANSFDGVLLSNIIEHLDRSKQAMKQVRRVLKRGGKVVITLPTLAAFKADPTHKKYWEPDEFKKFIEKTGFKVNKIYYRPFQSKLLREKIKCVELVIVAHAV